MQFLAKDAKEFIKNVREHGPFMQYNNPCMSTPPGQARDRFCVRYVRFMLMFSLRSLRENFLVPATPG